MTMAPVCARVSAAVVVMGLAMASAQHCPFYMDVAPCLCSESEPSHELDMDCSRVVDISQLTRIFQADFPSTNYRRLTMTGVPDNPIQLSFLPNGVFGPVTFKEVVVRHTQIRGIDEHVFIGSNDTLEALTVSHSELTSFPTTVLPLLSRLRQLDLSYNHLIFIPNLRSSSLQSLTLAYNSDFSFTDQTLTKLYHIVDLDIGNCNQEMLLPGMFLNMKNLSTVYLENNRLTRLDAASLEFTSLVVKELDLSGNQITTVEPNFLSGAGKQMYLELLNNRITTLAEATWRPVFQAISDPGQGLVMLDGNPLECGCTLAWLVTNKFLLSHLARGATCANGTAVHDLHPAVLYHDCGRSLNVLPEWIEK